MPVVPKLDLKKEDWKLSFQLITEQQFVEFVKNGAFWLVEKTAFNPQKWLNCKFLDMEVVNTKFKVSSKPLNINHTNYTLLKSVLNSASIWYRKIVVWTK